MFLNLETRLQEMGDNSVVYYGAVDELEHDVKVLKIHMSKLTAGFHGPSSNHSKQPRPP